jgi:hypothetical protein
MLKKTTKIVFMVAFVFLLTYIPVGVDANPPTTTISLNPTDDMSIAEEYPDVNFHHNWATPELFTLAQMLFVNPPYGGDINFDGECRALLKFDLSSIPANAVITQANVKLSWGWAHPPASVALIKVTQPWSETTVTWNNQPTTGAWFGITQIEHGPIIWDVKFDVQSIVNGGGYPNYGYELRYNEGWVAFSSKEASVIPVLEIEYVTQSPVAAFTPSITDADVDQTILFNAAASNDPNPGESIQQYSWDWDSDGTYDEYSTLSSLGIHQYSAPGTYAVTLEVTSTSGLTNTCTHTITVTDTMYYPVASFTQSSNYAPINGPVTFDPSGSNDFDGILVLYEWDWDNDGVYDESYATSQVVQHAWSEYGMGAYIVTLQVTDDEGLSERYSSSISMAPNVVPSIESCDSTGTPKDVFSPSETVYASGQGYQPGTTYMVYVVSDVTWTDGMNIPTAVTTTAITADESGYLPVTAVYNSAAPGKYDIVVDVNRDGKYNAWTDTLDDNDVVATAGLFVVPEYMLGGLLALLACFAAFLLVKKPQISLR